MRILFTIAACSLLAIAFLPLAAANVVDEIRPPPERHCTPDGEYMECCDYDPDTGQNLGNCDRYPKPQPPGQGCRPTCQLIDFIIGSV